jgi:Fe-S-cluster containining protein
MKICKRCGKCCKTKTLLKDCSFWIKVVWFLAVLIKNPKALREKPDCHFLTYENGLAKCLQYENRPQFCRDYYCEKSLV